MIITEQYRQLARYNTWMNEKLYAVAATIDDAERRRDLGAFFHSLHGTLNHLLFADRVWMWRFTKDPEIGQSRDHHGALIEMRALDQELYADFGELRAERAKTDRQIEQWVDGLTTERLAAPIQYHNMAGVPRGHPLWMAVTHFFNHETHHRGQVTTLLMQLGRDPGVTDFMVFLWASREADASAGSDEIQS